MTPASIIIASHVCLGDEEGALKTAAIQHIMSHLHEGAHASKDLPPIDLRIILGKATPNSVPFQVELGSETPPKFYYNMAQVPEEPDYISLRPATEPLTPLVFFGMLDVLRKTRPEAVEAAV